MVLIVEFELSSDRLPLTDVAAAAPSVVLRVDDILVSERNRPVLVLWAESETFESLETALEASERTTHSVLGTTEQRRLYRVELAERTPPIYTEFIRLDTAPVDARITPSGWQARTRFSDRQALAQFYESCTEHDISFRLDRVFEATPDTDDEYGLTQKQRETLIAAHEAGYFAVPRTCSLAEIGEQLDVSAPSVSERLRRALDRLVRHTVRLDEHG
ncbi:helix-turn-helix domain-containing protein [Halocatena salina]|uniref:Helix-turn-helix domain-containing protein n=1 Tax=Halocatena salina TaxID=2934340 RepID=A0A8U0A3Y2_9EURY|nr:helix-turn-helix domain-containing protein [Halocatena salina]UPM42657.1 helix-turn-helix domain-containing protein [Halocatena salina]